MAASSSKETLDHYDEEEDSSGSCELLTCSSYSASYIGTSAQAYQTSINENFPVFAAELPFLLRSQFQEEEVTGERLSQQYRSIFEQNCESTLPKVEEVLPNLNESLLLLSEKCSESTQATIFFGTYANQRVAAKVFNKKFKARGKAEAAIWTKLGAHPSILPLFGLTKFEGKLALLSVASDGTLETLLRTKQFSTRLPISIIIQLAKALRWLEIWEIVHGDLHPGNVLVSGQVFREGKLVACTVRLSDFGESIWARNRAQPRGASDWRAPDPYLTYKSDIFSLGCIWWQMLPLSVIHPRFARSQRGKPYPDLRGHEKSHQQHVYRTLALSMFSDTNQETLTKAGIRDIRGDVIDVAPDGLSLLLQLWKSCVDINPAGRPAAEELLKRLDALCFDREFFFHSLQEKGKNVAMARTSASSLVVYSVNHMVEQFSLEDWLADRVIASVGDGTTGTGGLWGGTPDEHGHCGALLAGSMLVIGGRKLHIINVSNSEVFSRFPPSTLPINRDLPFRPENQIFSLAYSASTNSIYCGLTWGAVGIWSALPPYAHKSIHYHLPEQRNYVWGLAVDDNYPAHLFFAGFSAAIIAFHRGIDDADPQSKSWVLFKQSTLRFVWSLVCSSVYLIAGDGNARLLLFPLLAVRDAVQECSSVVPTRAFSLLSGLLSQSEPSASSMMLHVQRIWKIVSSDCHKYLAAIVQDWHGITVVRVFNVRGDLEISALIPVYCSNTFYAGPMFRSIHFLPSPDPCFVFFNGTCLQTLHLDLAPTGDEVFEAPIF